MIHKKPMRLIAVTGNDRVNNRFVFLRSAPQSFRLFQMVGAVRREPAV